MSYLSKQLNAWRLSRGVMPDQKDLLIEALQSRITDLEQAQRWVSVDESEEDVTYWVSGWRYMDEKKGRYYLHAYLLGDQWFEVDSESKEPIYTPTHIRPITPPEEQEG